MPLNSDFKCKMNTLSADEDLLREDCYDTDLIMAKKRGAGYYGLIAFSIVLLVSGLFVFLSPLSFALLLGWYTMNDAVLGGITLGSFFAMVIGGILIIWLAIDSLKNG